VAEITFNAKAAGTAQFVLSNVNACDGSYRGANATTLRGGKVDIRKHQVSAPTPDVYRLAQNYPNPFNPTTGISYDIPEKADVFIGVYNVTGQLVKTLVNEEQDAGYYKVEWNGTDEADNKVSSGVYFYRMITDEYSDVKRMTLLK
jgi:flagellar hook assembly protein FlgD